jgi:hypothetical protein
LIIVLRLAKELFTYMETSPLPVKGSKIQAYPRRSGRVLYRATPVVIWGFIFFQSHPKEPNAVASYDIQEDVEDLF